METSRLILRKFTERDTEVPFPIPEDEEASKFLPWYSVKDLEETRWFCQERCAAKHGQSQAYVYTTCLKVDNFLVGYVKVDMEEHHDFGYRLRKEFQHRGIVTEAGGAVIAQVRKDDLPYITATHDRDNLRSGNVMRKLGMTCRYSYEELWQPKGFPVIFRMYQLSLNGDNEFVYRKYQDEATNHLVEDLQSDTKPAVPAGQAIAFCMFILYNKGAGIRSTPAPLSFICRHIGIKRNIVPVSVQIK